MSGLLFQNNDGACASAKAVLALIQSGMSGLENSWCKNKGGYLAEPKVARWENCREQGYVVYMRSDNWEKQINIAFFEHRNSDDICAVVWEGFYLNSPTINDIPESHQYNKGKWNVDKSVSYDEIVKMASYIVEELTKFWDKEVNNDKK